MYSYNLALKHGDVISTKFFAVSTFIVTAGTEYFSSEVLSNLDALKTKTAYS